MRLETLVLTNSVTPKFRQALELVIPYLDHFGVPYTLVDLLHDPLPAALADYPLILFAHPGVDARGVALGANGRSRLRDAVRSGCGLVSFDPDLANDLFATRAPAVAATAQMLLISGGAHFITKNHPASQQLLLRDSLRLPAAPAVDPLHSDILIQSGKTPFLVATRYERGRILNWASAAWMHSVVLGPLMGLDDLFWRGLAWAARKPFVLRGLPPLMTMRVDDVAGRGGIYGKTPLYWAEVANQFGFKPWMGIFIYNLDPQTVSQARDLVLRGQATAFPHAFGRPNRPVAVGAASPQFPFYYYENGLAPRAEYYDEFIYFDHQRGKPWSDAEAQRGLRAVDDWYAAHQPFPISPYAVPHFGEFGSNTVEHIQDRWNCDLFITYHGPDIPLEGASWQVAGPFRSYEEPGSALYISEQRGTRPVYYADFVNFGGRKFFLSYTEVRDETGYEWAPTEDIETTVAHGITQLTRARDSLALPVLFTHETDFIYKISPDRWADILEKVTKGIAHFQPIYVTLDEGIQYVRATHTSRIAGGRYDPASRELSLHLTGEADRPTHFCLFAEDAAGGEAGAGEGDYYELPAFTHQATVRIKI